MKTCSRRAGRSAMDAFDDVCDRQPGGRAWARGARGEGPQLPGPAPPQLLSDRGSSSPPPRPLAALAPSRAPQGRAAGGWSGTVPTFPHQRPTPPLPPRSLSQYEQDRLRRIAEINADPRCAAAQGAAQRTAEGRAGAWR